MTCRNSLSEASLTRRSVSWAASQRSSQRSTTLRVSRTSWAIVSFGTPAASRHIIAARSPIRRAIVRA